jgi:hypothetical protein
LPQEPGGLKRGRLRAGRLVPGWLALTLLLVAGLALLFTIDLDREGPEARVVGAPQMVFDWSREACAEDDLPDLPVRAFRDAGDQVVLIRSHYVNRRLVGADLDSLERSCDVLLQSAGDADPARFSDHEWIAATYTEDGRTVHALLHNEYQGHLHSGRCPSNTYERCWYNAVTSATSRDAGATFIHSRPPPGHLVASVPYQYLPDGGPFGLFSPSNIVRKEDDGYFYAMVLALAHQGQQPGSCLMRTRNLADPRSWRAWDGRAFSVEFLDPYAQAGVDPRGHLCQPVSPKEIRTMNASLTYNTFFDKYVLVDASMNYNPGKRRDVSGVYFSLSDDLVTWSERKLILETELRETFQCGDRDPIQYPSLLDPESSSRNFETAGQRAFLYYTQHHFSNCQPSNDRDLVRVPIEFRR